MPRKWRPSCSTEIASSRAQLEDTDLDADRVTVARRCEREVRELRQPSTTWDGTRNEY